MFGGVPRGTPPPPPRNTGGNTTEAHRRTFVRLLARALRPPLHLRSPRGLDDVVSASDGGLDGNLRRVQRRQVSRNGHGGALLGRGLRWHGWRTYTANSQKSSSNSPSNTLDEYVRAWIRNPIRTLSNQLVESVRESTLGLFENVEIEHTRNDLLSSQLDEQTRRAYSTSGLAPLFVTFFSSVLDGDVAEWVRRIHSTSRLVRHESRINSQHDSQTASTSRLVEQGNAGLCE